VSIKLMSIAWEADLPLAEKAVLLCLCDHANDDGECWPSMARVARRSSMSERTAQRAIKALRDRGILAWHDVPGRSHKFTIDPRRIVTPDNLSPPTMATKPPTQCHPTPDTVSPKPSRTIKQPSNDMSPDGDETFTFDDFVESWNAVATETGLPVLKAISKSRRTAFRQRQREFPEIADWQAAFRCLRTSKFLRGENDRDWKADADFFLRAKSFPKLVEGSYA
jgi:hypothetical protein